MKERPIIFSAPMILALKDKRKTQTRRVMKPQPHAGMRWGTVVVNGYGGWEDGHGSPRPCPYGQIGERLWVRETWWKETPLPVEVALGRTSQLIGYDATPECYLRIKGDVITYHTNANPKMAAAEWEMFSQWKRKSAMFMPRKFSRFLLEITGLAPERLQDISEEDAMAEGVERNWLGDNCPPEYANEWRNYQSGADGFPCHSARDSYRSLWDSINLKRGHGWDMNDWVWAIEYKVVEP